MSSSSNQNGGGVGGPIMGKSLNGEGGQSHNNVQASSNNQNQSNVNSILQNQLSAPPLFQQQHGSVGGMNNNGASHFHGHGHSLGGGGMEQHHNIHPQVQHHHIQQTSFANHLQHHLMDGQHSHQNQLGIPQQLSQGQSFSSHSQNSHHHHQQYMPFGLAGNNFGNAGNPYGNAGHQMNTNLFHPTHISSQQTAHGHGMNAMQQQPPPPFYMPHGHHHPSPCMMNYAPTHPISSQRTSAAVAGGGWMGTSGHIPPLPITNGPGCANGRGQSRNTLNQCGSSPPPVKAIMSSRGGHVDTDPNALPGGLEVLWRELHSDCQKLMVPQDVPDTAKFRGYFTVCELLLLKRTLEARYASGAKPPPCPAILPMAFNKNGDGEARSTFKVEEEEKQGKRGPKRKRGKEGKEDKNSEKSEKGKAKGGQRGRKKATKKENGDQPQESSSDPEKMQEDHENAILGELMIDLDETKHGEIHVSVPPAVTEVEVGGVVKAAMETLTAQSEQNANNDRGSEAPVLTNEKDVTDNTGSSNAGMRDENHCEHPPQLTMMNCDNNVNRMEESRPECAEKSSCVRELPPIAELLANGQQYGTCAPSDGSNNAVAASSMNTKVVGDPSALFNASKNAVHITTPCSPYPLYYQRPGGPGSSPQAQRTLTLVLKLIQIGPYKIKSYFLHNPNRLKVLFNSQRMTYECQIPVLTQDEKAVAQGMRKVLTIDIGFDQITKIDFKSDALSMQVEGAPSLQVSLNPAQVDFTEPNLTHEDVVLLNLIDQGQLQLHSVAHELSFLNEGQVRLLETQYQDHPRFRHLFYR